MAKIYARKYQKRIDEKEIILEEAINLVKIEVPDRWKDEVIALLHE